MKNKEESKVMHCPKCNEVVSINGCTWVEKMCVAYKTYKEVNSRMRKENLKQAMMKNGIIQGLHKQIGKLLDIMTEEQRGEAKELTQEMRDTIRSLENRELKNYKNMIEDEWDEPSIGYTVIRKSIKNKTTFSWEGFWSCFK